MWTWGGTIRKRRRRSSSGTRSTAPISPSIGSSMSAIAWTIVCRSSSRTARSWRRRSSTRRRWARARPGTSRSRRIRSRSTSTWPTARTTRCWWFSARRWSTSPASAKAGGSRASSTACTALRPTRKGTSTPPRRIAVSACRSSPTKGWRRWRRRIRAWCGRRGRSREQGLGTGDWGLAVASAAPPNASKESSVESR